MGASPPIGSSPPCGPVGGSPGSAACKTDIERNNEIISTVIIDINFSSYLIFCLF